jgi:hypothetical protein
VTEFIQGWRSLWAAVKDVGPAPAKDAPVGEHWHYVWRSGLSAMLTWQFLALFVIIETAAIIWNP